MPAKSGSSDNAPFDLEKLRELVELMEQHDLTEISLRRGEEHWRLRRGPREMVQMVPATGPASAPVAPAHTAPEATPDDGTIEIKSPTVGTFYTAASPDDPPFVSVGTKVQPDTIICLVEAMKVFNQIPAEVSGTITEVLIKNADPVEFGQALFKVRPG